MPEVSDDPCFICRVKGCICPLYSKESATLWAQAGFILNEEHRGRGDEGQVGREYRILSANLSFQSENIS